MKKYDFFVIGGGTAGMAAAAFAAKKGLKVAIADHSSLGGT